MMELLNTIFLEPLSHGFMQRGLIAAVMVGSVCAVLSCYMVLKGWSLMGDAISHAVLPGIVLAFITGLPFTLGAFIAGIICALGTGYIKDNSLVKEDTVMGIVFSGMFALGLVMLTKVETDIHLFHILFGNMLGITWYSIIETALIAGGTMLIVLLKWRDLMLYCFDPAYAKVAGLPVKKLHFGLLILLSLTIVASLKAVGIILVIAMLIAPGAIAFLLTKSFGKMMAVSSSVSVLCCVAGTIISYHIDAATGPCIVVLQAILFVIVFFVSTRSKTDLNPQPASP
jgi:manganese/iron transport system permease protein